MYKILHISKYYFPFRGGTEGVCQDVAEALSEYENKIICFNHENGSKTDYVNGIEVIRIGCFAKIASQSVSFLYRKTLKDLLQSWNPDVIHLHHPNLFVASILNCIIPKETKLVVHWHLDIVKQKMLYTLLKGIENKMLRRADVLIATSNSYISSSRPLLKFEEKVQAVYNGIRTTRLDQEVGDDEKILSIRREYGDKKIVFFVGRHVSYKGLKYLITADNYIKEDCVILIAGEGPLTLELKKQASASTRIKFLGKLSEETLRCYLHAAEIFAFPSIAKNEAFGLALAEGMYCECVPVTFTIKGSGVNEVSINGVTGIEVENGNAIKYAEAIDKLLNNDVLRSTYAKASKQRVIDLFSVEKEQESIQSLYKKLLNDI